MTNCSSEQANTQPALLSERTDSLCDTALDAGAVCCSSLSLNQVEQDLRGLVSTARSTSVTSDWVTVTTCTLLYLSQDGTHVLSSSLQTIRTHCNAN